MSDDSLTTKTVSALSTFGQVLSVFKQAVLAFLLMALEYARLKQKTAENKVKNLETDAQIRSAEDELNEQMDGKTADDIINDFLGSDSES